VFAFLYAVLAYHIGRYVFYDYSADQAAQEPKEPAWKRIWSFFNSSDKFYFWIQVYVFGCSVYFVMRLAMHELSQQTTDINAAIGKWMIFLLIGLLGTIWLREETTVSLLKRSSSLRTLVLGMLAVLVFMMPYIGVGGWGSYRGASDTRADQIETVFPTIVFTSDQPVIKEFDWEKTEQGFFQTEGKLYLLLENDGRLFVRPDGKGNQTVVITADSLSAYNLDFKSPWELPKAK